MTNVQELLEKEASLGNRQYHVIKQIKALRGETPRDCWGLDDCSTEILSRCPWRVDCGSYEASQWYTKNNPRFS